MDRRQGGARALPVPADVPVCKEPAAHDMHRPQLREGDTAMNPKAPMENGGGVLAGLRDKKKADGAPSSNSFLRTEKEDKHLREGKVPAGWSRGKDGQVRPMVQ
jgi:hypothetical protein